MDRTGGSLPWRSGPLGLAVALAVGLALSGCSARGGEAAGGELEREERALMVTVRNQNWSTVHGYVVLGSRSVSLGQVSTNREETFRVRSSVLGGHRSVRLLADPVGSTDAYMSDPILIDLGDRIEWTLRNPFSQSSVYVY